MTAVTKRVHKQPYQPLNHRVTKKITFEGVPARLSVNIQLADDCKNGHCDFSITGDVKATRFGNYRENYLTGGCIHDIILRHFPKLKPFIDLHLSDYNGAPMYAVGNGFYHLKEHDAEKSKRVTMEYLRITPEEYDEVKMAEDKDHLNFILMRLGVPVRWKEEAESARKELEKMTGVKFVNNSTRSNYEPLTPEQFNEIRMRLDSGYYSPEQLQERENARIKEANKKKLAKITKDRDKKINKAQNEYSVYKFLIDNNISTDNFIYYNHTNTGAFNWKNFGKQMSRNEFDAFLSIVDTRKLPEGIKFELK